MKSVGIRKSRTSAFVLWSEVRKHRVALDMANCTTALLMLAEFVLKLSVEPLLPETKCVATKALLDAFPTDAATRAQLEAVRVQCAHLMRLNPVGQADFLTCFDQWKRSKLTL